MTLCLTCMPKLRKAIVRCIEQSTMTRDQGGINGNDKMIIELADPEQGLFIYATVHIYISDVGPISIVSLDGGNPQPLFPDLSRRLAEARQQSN